MHEVLRTAMFTSLRVQLSTPISALLFALCYAQAPLFTSNQNTYFLHGLAWAGEGELARDWMASTQTSVPVFSAYVALVQGVPVVFTLVHMALAFVYLFSLLWVVEKVLQVQKPAVLVATALGMALLHWPPLLGVSGLGDVATHVTQGVAGQPLMRPFHQPSAFGVGLLLAFALAVWDRRGAAVVVAALVPWMHGAYFLPAALLTLGILLMEFREGGQRALGLGALSLMVVALPVWGAWSTFGATSPEIAAEAARILVHVRFPHHADPGTWVDGWALFQWLWVALGVAVAVSERHRLERRFSAQLMGLWMVGGLGMTAVVAATGSDRLALLLPWRLFVLLVPLSTALILGWGIQKGLRFVPVVHTTLERALLVLLVALSLWGLMGTGQSLLTRVGTNGLTEGVTCESGETFLIPPGQRSFRLATRCPIYVDWKSHPYKDVEVLEWKRRVDLAKRFYGTKSPPKQRQVLAEIRKDGVTHVVLPNKRAAGLGTVVHRGKGQAVVALP